LEAKEEKQDDENLFLAKEVANNIKKTYSTTNFIVRFFIGVRVARGKERELDLLILTQFL